MPLLINAATALSDGLFWAHLLVQSYRWDLLVLQVAPPRVCNTNSVCYTNTQPADSIKNLTLAPVSLAQ